MLPIVLKGLDDSFRFVLNLDHEEEHNKDAIEDAREEEVKETKVQDGEGNVQKKIDAWRDSQGISEGREDEWRQRINNHKEQGDEHEAVN